ncbi:NAD(P)-binding protein [Aspergillus homomorphus CBS 101889]|uniref:NAD(P)-binding protein n=1 Tax=Aspergillus homomorphus (strain CBS 101889) TaxID=1450537 RepID=A0A395HR71_ASPHC|nr:NAD(P)-binding protein [Aspergillus homomorphus CBS 101889]RAL08754.1 NAD(P)-binding protein [Aspergillus homomorphus CBS 101889]
MTAILVTGATGKQGGSVVRNLLAQNAPFDILAVTRNAQSSSAQKLAQQSPKIKLLEGNLDNPEALFRAAKSAISTPIWGVFSVQAADPRNDSERRQGLALVDESIKQDVKFFVYSSVDRGGEASIDNPTEVPHFIYKHEIEKHLIAASKGTGMEWAVLRPTAFFENLTPDYFGRVFATAWHMALKGKPLQLIATSDIGFFAAHAFLHPEESRGKFFSLAGDELTYDQMATIFKQKTGKDVPTTYRLPVRLMMMAVKELGVMFKWFYEQGYGADIEALRKISPVLKDFGTWVETESGFRKR